MKSKNRDYTTITQRMCKIWRLNGFKGFHAKTKSARETQRCLRQLLHTEENPRSAKTDNSLTFIEACEELIAIVRDLLHTEQEQMELQSELF